MLLSSAFWANCVHSACALFWLGAFAAALDTPVVYKRQLFFHQSHGTFLPFINLLLITSGFKIAYSHESAIFCVVWQHTNLLFIQLLDYTTVGQIPSLCVIFSEDWKCFWDVSRILHGVSVCTEYTSRCCRNTWEPSSSTASSMNGLILASCLPSPMAMGYISHVTLRNG